MKCPYNGFKECIVEKCPSCNYEKIERKVLEGRSPNWMDTETAISRGCMWESTKITYKFISCKLADNCVQPIPAKEENIINNDNRKTVTIVRRSIF